MPGGVARDLDADGMARVDGAAGGHPPARSRELVELYDNTASLQDRTATTGILRAELARQFGAGGYVGRASGRAFDARKIARLPRPTISSTSTFLCCETGDVNARVWIRIREVEQSLGADRADPATLCPTARSGPSVSLARRERAKVSGLAEAFRGDVLAWVRLDGDRVARCHLRDPSWFQWPLLEAVIEGNIVARLPALQQIVQLLLFRT